MRMSLVGFLMDDLEERVTEIEDTLADLSYQIFEVGRGVRRCLRMLQQQAEEDEDDEGEGWSIDDLLN